MPTYEYQCRACNHEFELFQQMSDSVKRKCPECGKLKLTRLFGTGGAVIFKGSGFYETDYRSKSYQQGEAAEKKAQKTSSSSEGKDGASKKSDVKKDTPAKPAPKSSD